MMWSLQFLFIPLLSGISILAAYWQRKKRRNPEVEKLWTTLPTVGLRKDSWLGWFGWFHAILRSITSSSKNALEGYREFSRHGKLFVMPSTGCGAIVMLAPSQLNILDKSEHEVQAFHAQMESHQPRYTMDDQSVYENILHFDIVRNQLTKNVAHFALMTEEELKVAFSESCHDTNWTTVNAWDLCAKVIAQVGNRAYVGFPLCRDEALLDCSRRYATAVYTSAAVITTLPSFMRPVIGHIVAIPAQRYLRKCKQILVPYIQGRLDHLHNGDVPVRPSKSMNLRRC
jgi:hypothetical protein